MQVRRCGNASLSVTRTGGEEGSVDPEAFISCSLTKAVFTGGAFLVLSIFSRWLTRDFPVKVLLGHRR